MSKITKLAVVKHTKSCIAYLKSQELPVTISSKQFSDVKELLFNAHTVCTSSISKVTRFFKTSTCSKESAR